MRLLIAIALLLASSIAARAACECQCVDGRMQPLCDSAIDMRPMCPAMLCPMAPPSLAPIAPQTLPPLGTTQCRQARVCDVMGHCGWQEVCR